MKRYWFVGLTSSLAIIGLALAIFAGARRSRAAVRLAEMEKASRSIQAEMILRKAPAARVGDRIGQPSPEPPSRLLVVAAKGRDAVTPDLNEIFTSHPELAAAYQIATAGRLHQTYDRLFARLGLSSPQIEQVVSKLMRDDENEIDLAMTAKALKLSRDDPVLRQFRRDQIAEMQTALESVLGSQGNQSLQDYNRALALRTTAEDIASMTAASESPMTGAQTEQLTQLLAQATASDRSGGRPDLKFVDWEEVLTKAASFLAPSQVAALRAKAQQAKTAALLSQFYAGRARK